MKLPADLQESLSERDYAAVAAWWESLTPQQQRDYSDTARLEAEGFSPLPNLDEMDPEFELFPFYEYLANHELRLVNFVADEEAKSAHRIVSSYIAMLGSDYRHGQSGTVW